MKITDLIELLQEEQFAFGDGVEVVLHDHRTGAFVPVEDVE